MQAIKREDLAKAEIAGGNCKTTCVPPSKAPEQSTPTPPPPSPMYKL